MKGDKMFPITSVCINDIIQAIEDNYCGNDELQKMILVRKARKLDEGDMVWIAQKLSDSFLNTDFWIVLADCFKQIAKEDGRYKRNKREDN